MPAPTSLPLWINLAVFAVAAALVWAAGTKVARYADVISDRTGIGEAVLGLLLIGGITSLPEVAVTVSSSAIGNAPLAVNNIMGSSALNVTLLALADMAIRREALTSVIATPAVLLQGTLDILLLALVAAGTLMGGAGLLGISVWSWAILPFYALSIWLLAAAGGRRPWVPNRELRHGEPSEPRTTRQKADRASAERSNEHLPDLRSTLVRMVAAAGVILVAGYVLSRTGDAIAEQSSIGASFTGYALLAAATSLPEVSTILASVRLQRYEMAVSDIFGTNLFNLILIFVIDAVYAGGPVLAEAGRFATFAALLAIVVTTIYLAGLIERRDRTVLGLGVDSAVVLTVYGVGLWVLYGLR